MSEDFRDRVTTFPLFKGITSQGADILLGRGEMQTHEAGTLLFKEGDPAAFAVLVLIGHLQAFVDRNGRDVVVSEMEPGSLVGELSVLSGIPRSASVRCTETSTLAVWDQKAFRSMLLSNPFLSERILGQALRGLIDKERALIDELVRAQSGQSG
jgi:CRP-like cAMP-binding protein